MRVIVVAGTCSGVGKSSLALGLMAAYTRRGLRVQPFKIGPDFVYPMHHKAATGNESFNLDTWMMSREMNLALFTRCAGDADVAIVEGVMGLFDGLDGKSESGSTAEIAKLLGAPVLLVVDSTGLARSAAALVRGYTTFDPDVKFAGIIFNKVEIPAHKGWLIDAVTATEENIKVLGGIPTTCGLSLSEQHFHVNLIPDESAPAGYIRKFCDLVEHNVDLDGLLETASLYRPKPYTWEQLRSYISSSPYAKQVRIGVARDAAFCLYYQANFALLQDAGAELVFFSPIRDVLPTRLDAILLGDGYPEQHLEQLSSNKPMLYAIKAFADAGGIIYGEACGLMYLSQGIENHEHKLFSMVGVFPFSTQLQPSVKQFNYVKVVPQENCVLFPPEVGEIRGQVHNTTTIVWEQTEGINVCPRGFLLKHECPDMLEELEGYMQGNTMGSSARLNFGSNPAVVLALMERCRLDSTKAAAVAAASASAVANAGPAAAAAAGLAAARAVADALGESREFSDLGNDTAFLRHSRSLNSSPVHINAEVPEVDKSAYKRRLTRSKSASWDGTNRRNLEEIKTEKAAPEDDFLKSAIDEAWPSLLQRRTMSLASMEQSSTTTFKDGRIHNQRHVPQKIVSLLPLATELIVKLGAGNRLLGLTDMCDKPFGVRMGRHVVCRAQQSDPDNPFKLDVPWISRVKPDLLVTQNVCSMCSIDSKAVAEAITRADGKMMTMLVLNPYTLSDVWTSIIELGDLLGLYNEACMLVNTLRSRLRRVANAVSSQRRRNFLLLQNLAPLVLGGRWIAEVEMLAGAFDGLQKPGCYSEELPWQRVTSYAPEVLVLAPCSLSVEETLAEVHKLARLPGFWSLPAVESRQVYICDGSFFSRHGLKLVEGTELLAHILHPSAAAAMGLASGVLKMSLKHGRKARAEDLQRYFKPLAF